MIYVSPFRKGRVRITPSIPLKLRGKDWSNPTRPPLNIRGGVKDGKVTIPPS